MASTRDLNLRIRLLGAATASQGIRGVGREVGTLEGRVRRAHRAVGLFSGALGGLAGYATVGGLAKAATTAAKFEASMLRLHTQGQAGLGTVGKFSNYILANAPKWGTAPNELALAMQHIVYAGFKGKDAMMALDSAARGAQVGGSDLITTTNALTGAMVDNLVSAKNSAQAMGVFNGIVGAGDMTMQQLAQSMGAGTLAVAAQFGLKIKDVGAALAVFGDRNVRGADAATKLRQVLFAIGSKKTSAQQAAYAMLGFSPDALATDLRKPGGLLLAFRDLKKHADASGLSAQKVSETLSQMFGRGRTSAGALMLFRSLDQGAKGTRLGDKYRMLPGPEQAGKVFERSWKETTKTFQFLINQAKALGEVLAIRVGRVVEKVVRWVLHLVAAFKQGKVWAVAIVSVLAGLAAMVGLAAVEAAIVGIVGALVGLGAAVGVLGLLVGIGAAIYVLYEKVPAVHKFIDGLWASLKVGFARLKNAAMDAVHWVVNAFHNVMAVINTVIGWVKEHWILIRDILLAPFAPFVAAFLVFKKLIIDNFHAIVGVIKAVWGAVFNILKIPFLLAWNFLKIQFKLWKFGISTAVDVIKGIWHFLWGILSGPFNFLWNKVIKPVMNWIVGAVRWMVGIVSKLLGKILGPIKDVVGAIGSVAGAVGGGINAAGGFLGSLIPGNYQGGLVQYRSMGGPLGIDTIPMWAAPGEYMLNRKQVSEVGVSTLEAWRRGGDPPGSGSGVLEATLNLNVDGVLMARSVQRAALRQKALT